LWSRQGSKERQSPGKQRCGHNFVGGDGRAKPNAATRALAVILHSLGKGSYGFIAKLFGVTPAAVLKWVRQEAAGLPEPGVPGGILEMEFDEMRHFVGSKKQALDHQDLESCYRANRLAWVVGHRDAETFRRLYDKVKRPKPTPLLC
jgi:hypothetical protein